MQPSGLNFSCTVSFHVKTDIQADLSQLPNWIREVLVTYSVSEPKWREAAQRTKLPLDQIYYDSNYGPTPRQGIMISSGAYEGGELLTTSGIPVESREGEHFIAVAFHGFPLGQDTVYHPNENGSRIGEVQKKLWDTDISLVSDEGLGYSCETFNSDMRSSPILRGLKHPDDVFSGRCEGYVSRILFTSIPSDEDVSELHWVNAYWVYIGNGRDEPVNGS
jgi:hypothetical protein